MNYRVITINTRDGSLFDIAEFENFADVIAWRSSGRFVGNVHTFVVDISSPDPSMWYVIQSRFSPNADDYGREPMADKLDY